MIKKLDIARNWLPRYTGMPLEKFGPDILLTNFDNYVNTFCERFDCDYWGKGRPMQAATNNDGLTIVNFGIGSSNAATIMDLLSAVETQAVLFLGKCGGLKKSSEIGHFILPIAAIRGEGTSDDYLHPKVPALPSFKLHKFVSDKIVEAGHDYRTGVIYTTNRRVWEHDQKFHTPAPRNDLYRHRYGNRDHFHRGPRKSDFAWRPVAGVRRAGDARWRENRGIRQDYHP